jgi:hypothetical protein
MAERSSCGIDIAKDRLDVMLLPEDGGLTKAATGREYHMAPFGRPAQSF